MSFPGPFADKPNKFHPTLSASYQRKVDDLLRRRPVFKKLKAFAVLDLTRGSKLFAGANTQANSSAASVVKIAAMFAAFRLRKNVKAAARAAKANNKRELIDEIEDHWEPILEDTFSRGREDFPDLEEIFTITGGSRAWTIEFDSRFKDRMKKMVSESDNFSAAFCINRLGYNYINGALEAEGLMDRKHGGLFLSADYYRAKGKRLRQKRRHDRRYRYRDWTTRPFRDSPFKSSQNVTARSLTHFVSSLYHESLVDKRSSREMQKCMDTSTDDWFRNALEDHGRPVNRIFNKIGIYKGYDEVSFIERTGVAGVPGGTIRYILVALREPVGYSLIEALAIFFDDLVWDHWRHP